jgi:hypothetical protein
MDPDPTPDPTPSFIDFKDAKKIFFTCIFFLELANRQIIFSLKKKFAKIIVLKCYSAGIISVRSTHL